MTTTPRPTGASTDASSRAARRRDASALRLTVRDLGTLIGLVVICRRLRAACRTCS